MSPCLIFLQQNPSLTFDGVIGDTGFQFSRVGADPEALTAENEIRDCRTRLTPARHPMQLFSIGCNRSVCRFHSTMSESPFYRLAPFIQEYIYRKGWDELRPIQVQAIEAILDTPHHVLIASGTASGKTEAALLPILTDLDRRPSSSIGVLYIGPLKALINDQFERLQALLEETNIPVQSWHGDIAQGKKERFLKQAQGILQITPESLEAMLINRHGDLRRLFGDLRYVILDEVHALIGSDRGRQVLCQLQRLARVQQEPARRIGLSATIGDTAIVQRWLAGGTTEPAILLEDKQSKRAVEARTGVLPDPGSRRDRGCRRGGRKAG